jgi:hypothetical protein
MIPRQGLSAVTWQIARFQTLASGGALDSLLAALGGVSPRVVALVDERLDLERGLHYADFELFRIEDGRARSTGRYSGREREPFSRITDELGCR